MVKAKNEDVVVALGPALAQVAGSGRAAQLLQQLRSLTAEDLAELDRTIAGHKAQYAALRRARALVAEALGVATPPTAKRSKPTTPEQLADKFQELRVRVVKFLANGPQRAHDIIRECRVAPSYITEVLNHAWFAQTSQGVHITPEGRRACLE